MSERNSFAFEYMLLDRCRCDCDYYLGYGNGQVKYLWGGEEHAHIAKMRELYALVPEKPEWLTEENINYYESQMCARGRKEDENR